MKREERGKRERERERERERKKIDVFQTSFALTFAFAAISRRTHSLWPPLDA
jgi:hypothetical protein